MLYRFGDHNLDTNSFVLAANGQEIAVEPQVFTLLQYLLENRERVVSKDDLINHVWDGRIVSDAAITSAINLARRGFRFVAGITEDRAPADMPAPDPVSASTKTSIAVLPFENLSADPEQDYFSDGMAEDLITDLSKISNLIVAARNSSFSFKGQMLDVRDVAAKLGVSYVLEGSVRKMGDKLRINAQLIDVGAGNHLWAERYDGDMAEIFEFQDRIRAKIVSALELKLTPSDRSVVERKPTDNLQAYDLFLKGRAEYHRFKPENLLEARKYLEQAIEIDPNFADAYGYLSYCHFYAWALYWPGFEHNLDQSIALAEKGVQLGGASVVALTRLGWIQTFFKRHDQALENLEMSIKLAPDNADVNATFGQVLNYLGHPERALTMMERAFALEMLVPPNWEYQVGLAHYLLRQYNEALACFGRAVPMFSTAYAYITRVHAEIDQPDEAGDAVKKFLEYAPHYTLKNVQKLLPYRLDEVRERILASLGKAGLAVTG